MFNALQWEYLYVKANTIFMNENRNHTSFEKEESDQPEQTMDFAQENNQPKSAQNNSILESDPIERYDLKSATNGLSHNNHETKELRIANHNPKNFSVASDILKLVVKNGEYVYARPNDIVMMESCDHLVKVYLAYDNKYKKAIRSSTLKNFLLQLPEKQFLRIGRFCAVNLKRLSGGNYNEQSFEFDFRISIKLKHAISHTLFNAIGM